MTEEAVEATPTHATDEALGERAAVAIVQEGLRASFTERRSAAFARAAVNRFRTEFSERGLVRDMIEGARQGAEALNVETFHGIVEVVQNAEDQGAADVRIGIAINGKDRQLLLVHNGSPVEFRHLVAMSYAFLSTKRQDASATGRFGVGLKTLSRVGDQLEVHCSPYDVVIDAAGPRPIRGVPAIAGFYNRDAGETMLRLRLSADFEWDAFQQWFMGLGGMVLLFLNRVSSLTLFDLRTGGLQVLAAHQVSRSQPRRAQEFNRANAQPISVVHVRDGTRHSWIRVSTEFPVPRNLARSNKSTGPTTSVAIAVDSRHETGRIYAGLPLRVESGLSLSINAQFDPDTARVTLREGEWNRWLLKRVGELIQSVARTEFRRRPIQAWKWIPLVEEADVPGQPWLAGELSNLVAKVHAGLRRHAALRLDADDVRLKDIVYEDISLEGLVRSADLERLRTGKSALPLSERDSGRWRKVLDGIAASDQVDITDATAMFDWDDRREPTWYVEMAARCLQAELGLTDYRCLLLESGTVVAPPDSNSGQALVLGADISHLATSLGLALPLHAAYRNDGPSARSVRQSLEQMGVLQRAISDREALTLVGRRDDSLVVTDAELIAIRNALASFRGDERRDLGKAVGSVISVDGYEFIPTDGRDREQIRHMKVFPAEAYLPPGIEASGKLSWPKAAHHVPGLQWIDGRYRKILQTEADSLGARALFNALGAAISPRLLEPSAPEYRGGAPAFKRLMDAGGLQEDAIAGLSGWVTHIRDERVSPDLDLVIADLLTRPVAARRDRASALLATIAEHWRLDYADFSVVDAVHSYYGWANVGKVSAAWLSRLASLPWLSNLRRQPRAPRELAAKTARNLEVFGDNPKVYGAEFGSVLGKYDHVLEALGVTVEPKVSQILDQLQELRRTASKRDRNTALNAAALYDALAEHCARVEGPVRQDTLVGDVRVDSIRATFGIGKGRGLILADGEWRAPRAVFRGRPIFGSRRPFVPERRRADRLWEVLNVRLPSITDCIAVLNEIATEPPDARVDGILIEVYRHLASVKPDNAADRDGLARAPLWTGSRWARARPVFAVDDPVIAASIGERLPMWLPPMTLETLVDLPQTLGVTVVDPARFVPVGLNEAAFDRGVHLLPNFRHAVSHLRARMTRGDLATFESLAAGWDALASARLAVTPELGIEIRIQQQAEFSVPIPAHVQQQGDVLILGLSSADNAGEEETVGRAIASLFGVRGVAAPVDREKIALAWAAAWRAASSGAAVDSVELPTDGAGEDDALGGLETELRAAAKARRSQGDPLKKRERDALPESGDSTPGRNEAPAAQAPVALRRLKDLQDLLITDITIRPGTAKARGRQPAGDGGLVDPPPANERDLRAGAGSRTVARAYTDDERESLAVEVLRWLLQTNKRVLADLRHVGRLGADVVDNLNRYFEIKASAGEMPDMVSLQVSQVRRSLESPSGTWFLVVVSGLEEGYETRVRFIADPLKALTWVEHGAVTFTGVRTAKGVDAVLS